jgi:lincosamide nucleotidyltransferase A/C/D/E
MLSDRGVDVVGLDPAGASLDVARGKPGAERVRWVHGDATALPGDLDGMVDLAVMTANVAQAIVDECYAVETDWLPVRVEVVAAGRGWVDVHPVRLAPDGSGVQAGLNGTRFDYPADCFAIGSLAGRGVPCLTAARQRLLHTGYETRPQDVHDLGLLTKLGGANPG